MPQLQAVGATGRDRIPNYVTDRPVPSSGMAKTYDAKYTVTVADAETAAAAVPGITDPLLVARIFGLYESLGIHHLYDTISKTVGAREAALFVVALAGHGDGTILQSISTASDAVLAGVAADPSARQQLAAAESLSDVIAALAAADVAFSAAATANQCRLLSDMASVAMAGMVGGDARPLRGCSDTARQEFPRPPAQNERRRIG